MTEKDAAIAYARMWNRLDATEFVQLLAPDARYSSQYVFNDLLGREEIAEYFVGKMRAVRQSATTVVAELGKAQNSYFVFTTSPTGEVPAQQDIGGGMFGRDCVLLTQSGEGPDQRAAVLFEVDENGIKGIDLCIAGLINALPMGERPT